MMKMKQADNEREQMCPVERRSPRGQRLSLWTVLPRLFVGTVFLASGFSLEGSEAKPQGEAFGAYLWLQLCDTSGVETVTLDELALRGFETLPTPGGGTRDVRCLRIKWRHS